jgi:greA: transcription elongation factor GreA
MAEAKKNILTPDGLKALEDELQELKVVRRKEIAQKIKEAREQGDLSENANMMQPKMNSVTWKHVSKRSKRS